MDYIGLIAFFLAQLFILALALRQTKLTKEVKLNKAFMVWLWIVIFQIAVGLIFGVIQQLVS